MREFNDLLSGAGKGVLSYRCVYRTVADDNTCLFNVDCQPEVLNEDQIEEIKRGEKNLRMRMTVSIEEKASHFFICYS